MKNYYLSFLLIALMYSCNQNNEAANIKVKKDVVNKSDFEYYKVEFREVDEYALPKERDLFLGMADDYDSFVKNYKSLKPNFAGYFVLSSIGCGTCCNSYQMIDVRDGKVYSIPKKDDWVEIRRELIHSRESSLLIISAMQCDYSGEDISDVNLGTVVAFWNDNDKQFYDVYTKQTFEKNTGGAEDLSVIEGFPRELLGEWSSNCGGNPFESISLSISNETIIGYEFAAKIVNVNGSRGKYKLVLDVLDITTDEIDYREEWDVTIKDEALRIGNEKALRKCSGKTQ